MGSVMMRARVQPRGPTLRQREATGFDPEFEDPALYRLKFPVSWRSTNSPSLQGDQMLLTTFPSRPLAPCGPARSIVVSIGRSPSSPTSPCAPGRYHRPATPAATATWNDGAYVRDGRSARRSRGRPLRVGHRAHARPRRRHRRPHVERADPPAAHPRRRRHDRRATPTAASPSRCRRRPRRSRARSRSPSAPPAVAEVAGAGDQSADSATNDTE